MKAFSPARVKFSQFFSGLDGLLSKLTPLLKNSKGLESDKGQSIPKGKVFIVGAGPGDPELLTLKAARLIQNADVILYDALVNDEILKLAQKTALCQYVGKRAGQHSMRQKNISELMVAHALEGKSVVRVKGGDPGLFARSAEECIKLAEKNIPFAIVPGITAASGMSAYTGIMLTDRDYAQSVQYITARFQNEADEPNWQHIAAHAETQTTVFYMGVQRLSLISERLLEAGIAPDMPMLLCEKASQKEQKLIVSTVSSLAEKVAGKNITGPGLIVLGRTCQRRHNVEQALMENHDLYL
ncbi:uroporphyrinogen-III C-methyltransferase [Agaribacter flavus]|uniref:uroporphyrinogen-III C-methyltransferase n=1 Tax=Agaribacter flavus TaxID=1902781 RepID=A0ABV7FNN4_9ALTE